jgi:hypothetical protein
VIQIRCEKETKEWFKAFSKNFRSMEDALLDLKKHYTKIGYV